MTGLLLTEMCIYLAEAGASCVSQGEGGAPCGGRGFAPEKHYAPHLTAAMAEAVARCPAKLGTPPLVTIGRRSAKRLLETSAFAHIQQTSHDSAKCIADLDRTLCASLAGTGHPEALVRVLEQGPQFIRAAFEFDTPPFTGLADVVSGFFEAFIRFHHPEASIAVLLTQPAARSYAVCCRADWSLGG